MLKGRLTESYINALNGKLLVTPLVQCNGLFFLYIILTKCRWVDVLQFWRTIFHAKLGRMHVINYNNWCTNTIWLSNTKYTYSLHVILVSNVSGACWVLVVFARACSCKYHVLKLWKYNLYSELISLLVSFLFIKLHALHQ